MIYFIFLTLFMKNIFIFIWKVNRDIIEHQNNLCAFDKSERTS